MLPKPSRLVGHLACGDEDSSLNGQQLEKFERAAKLWPGVPAQPFGDGRVVPGQAVPFRRSAPGIGLYGGGLAPAEGSPPHMVVTLTALVLQVRDVKKGETVGYGRYMDRRC